jgi:hypothetical protein
MDFLQVSKREHPGLLLGLSRKKNEFNDEKR